MEIPGVAPPQSTGDGGVSAGEVHGIVMELDGKCKYGVIS